ncbi:MAG: phosphate signaling complex protein PhoU [Desulfobulbaceae bacterium]|nr:phosphate signaling complex protein PhoU [Desulfobulbaceae bacterium]
MIQSLAVEREKLKQRLLQLGSEVENNLIKAEKALINFDPKLAAEIVSADVGIDDLEISVEEKCMQIFARHQPVAGDLRFVVTVLKINNDLERIGDLAAKIADRILLLARKEYVPFSSQQTAQFPEQFRQMFAESIKMVKMSLDSFVDMDADLAYKVRLWDDQVDEAKKAIRVQIEAIIQSDSSQQQYLGMLLSVSRSLERIADHATHIAEDVIYMLQGLIVRHVTEGRGRMGG